MTGTPPRLDSFSPVGSAAMLAEGDKAPAFTLPDLNGHTTYQGGSTITLRVQLLDNHGTNLGSSKTTLTLLNPAVSPSPSPGQQPTGTFNLIAKGNPTYQYDLKAKDYPAGTYTFSFTVTGDPVRATKSMWNISPAPMVKLENLL